MDDVDAGLNVGEGVRGGEDGLPLELLVQVTVRPPIQRERRAVDEAAQVVVFVKVRDAVLHLVRVKVRLHVRYLDEGLRAARGGQGSRRSRPAFTSSLIRQQQAATLLGSSLHLSTGLESLMTSTWSSPNRSP